MIYDVVISKQAERDLREIYEYIALELQANENASRQLECLEERILSLEQMPNRFQKYEKEPWHSFGMRFIPVDNYIIFYIPDMEKQVVSILRIMYAGRELES